MSSKEYEFPLDEEAQEWLRIRFTRTGRDVDAFMVQYETTINGERLPVARYDGAHGRAHRDLLNRKGEVIDKRWLPGTPTFQDALKMGRDDFSAHWSRYRDRFRRAAR